MDFHFTLALDDGVMYAIMAASVMIAAIVAFYKASKFYTYQKGGE